jgi:hypothetical protein
MSQQRRGLGPRIPQVNLFEAPERGLSMMKLPGRTVELVLLVFVLVIWGGVGVGIALLFGWRPPVGLGT